MDGYLTLSDERRRALCGAAGDELGMSPAAVEKDFWVCWILRELFSLDETGPHLTFKGGTSLSKGWALIDRFSEDIDIVIDRELLGFGGEDGPEAAPSNHNRRVRLEALVASCQQHIERTLAPALRERLRARLGREGSWKLSEDPDDPDRQALLFEYAPIFESGSYVRPIVRIELGARSDTEPSATPTISPYVAKAPAHDLGDSAFQVRAVAPERTFWEKAMLLHEESFRDGNPRARLSRHYYDLWCLQRGGVATSAIADLALFGRVVEHRAVFFQRSRAAHDSMKPGSIRLVPKDEALGEWKRDYEPMREAMIFGETPTFEDLIAVARDLEARINRSAAP